MKKGTLKKMKEYQNLRKYDRLFNPDDMLDDVIKKYVDGKITKNDVIFYIEWNDFELSDVDWKLVENERIKK